ncbi:CRAL/TRIO domain [Nesidiocoris tenuis]|uniref:CRAL/TRIO domain n=1 Tax=Nesidiocoris tenuis TaxID=355587 RepID=A0ABN7AAJ0_9HEMI|nr:CRAL/TRIO domain [Nesidiocoris tenuis]
MSQNTDMQLIKSWLSKQSHLPTNIDDHLIERFLECCGHSLEKTKYTMDLFFCLRAEAPEFFLDRDPLSPTMQAVFSMLDLLPLPQTTPEGYKVFLYRLADTDADKFHFNDYVKCFFLVGDTRIKTEQTIPKGEVIIFDMTGYTLKHLTRVNLLSLRKYMQYTQEAHPVRLKQIHVINVSSLLDRTLMISKPFIKGEVFGMIHFHQPDSKTLYDYVPAEILPNEYGGKAGTVADIKETWKTKVEKNRDWFRSNPWIANNSKRANDKKTTFNIMEGSFRTLTID